MLPVNWELSEPLSSSVITEGSCMGRTTGVHQKKKKKKTLKHSLTLDVLRNSTFGSIYSARNVNMLGNNWRPVADMLTC